MRTAYIALAASALILPSRSHAQAAERASHDRHTSEEHGAHVARADSAFRRMQARGRVAMGVDQYTSHHVFVPLSNGGRISLQSSRADEGGTATVRTHMRSIAEAFAAGNFDLPGYVHAGKVPGTDVMRAKASLIHYNTKDLARGGEVRITTDDPAALNAVHQFLAFQIREHRTGERNTALGNDSRGVNARSNPSAPARRRQL